MNTTLIFSISLLESVEFEVYLIFLIIPTASAVSKLVQLAFENLLLLETYKISPMTYSCNCPFTWVSKNDPGKTCSDAPGESVNSIPVPSLFILIYPPLFSSYESVHHADS